MRFAWVFNLDADLELTHPGYCTSDLLREQLARHGASSRALMGPKDVLATPGAGAGCIGRAWCPTPKAVAQLQACGATPEPHPSRDILRRVNHRRFAFELGGGLPEQAYVETRAALDDILRDTSRPWLLKRPLAFAGRGQSRVEGAIGAKQEAWITASLRDDGLVVEPLVTPTQEVSVHGFVWRDAHFELGNICLQQVSALGVFRGVRRAEAADLLATERETLLAAGENVARALAAAGYFGPFGIDAYRYASPALSGFCALSEINARYTLGFAVGFARPAHALEL